MLQRGDELVTSTLAVAELLMKPVREGRHELAKQYREILSDPAVDVVGFDMRAALVYPEIRARGIKPSDSIHLACASVARVNLLLTNDADLTRQQIPDIAFITTLDRAPL